MPPTLKGRRVTLRPIRPEDLPRLREIMRSPSVRPWWGTPKDDATLDRELTAVDGGEALAIEAEGTLVGWADYYEETEPDYRYAGLDISLAEEAQGHGYGPEALRVLARWLVSEKGHHRLIIDPALANERAIHVYEKVGFRPVGVMRSYERGPDGAWHDGLLMDMLAEEITDDPER